MRLFLVELFAKDEIELFAVFFTAENEDTELLTLPPSAAAAFLAAKDISTGMEERDAVKGVRAIFDLVSNKPESTESRLFSLKACSRFLADIFSLRDELFLDAILSYAAGAA